MMKGIRLFIQSLGYRRIKPAIYGWLPNIMASAVVYLGLYKLMEDAAGKTFIPFQLGSDFSLFTFFGDIFVNHHSGLSLVLFLSTAAATAYFLFSIFTAGGIWSILLQKEQPPTYAGLAAASFTNFGAMLKIFISSVILWAFIFIIPALLFYIFLYFQNYNETLIQVMFYSWILIAVLHLAFASMVYDFSRVIRLRGEKRIFTILKQAIRFALSNKRDIFGLFAMYIFSLLAFYLLYAAFVLVLEPILLTVVIMVVYQVFMILRYYLKVTMMLAEIRLMEPGNIQTPEPQ